MPSTSLIFPKRARPSTKLRGFWLAEDLDEAMGRYYHIYLILPLYDRQQIVLSVDGNVQTKGRVCTRPSAFYD